MPEPGLGPPPSGPGSIRGRAVTIPRWKGPRTVLLAALFALLPGFPVLLLSFGGVVAAVRHPRAGFQIALTLSNLYLSVPASVFGSSLFPPGEFGYVPTTAGLLFAFGFYAVIAIAISIVVDRVRCYRWLGRRRGRLGPDGQPLTPGSVRPGAAGQHPGNRER